MKNFLLKSFDTFICIKGTFGIPFIIFIIISKILFSLSTFFEINSLYVLIPYYIGFIIILNVYSEQLKNYWYDVFYKMVTNPTWLSIITEFMLTRYTTYFINNQAATIGSILGFSFVGYFMIGPFAFFVDVELPNYLVLLYTVPSGLILLIFVMWLSFRDHWLLYFEHRYPIDNEIGENFFGESHLNDKNGCSLTHQDFDAIVLYNCITLYEKRRKPTVSRGTHYQQKRQVHELLQKIFGDAATATLKKIGGATVDSSVKLARDLDPKTKELAIKTSGKVVGAAFVSVATVVSLQTYTASQIELKKQADKVTQDQAELALAQAKLAFEIDKQKAEFVINCHEKGIYIAPTEVYGVKIGSNTDDIAVKVNPSSNINKNNFDSKYWEYASARAKDLPPKVPSPKEELSLTFFKKVLSFFGV